MVEANRTIKIKQLSGPELTLQVDPNVSISELKDMIHAKNSMPQAAQRLIYQARPLQDSGKLSDYVTEDNQAIHLVTIPSAAAGSGASQPPPQQQRPQQQQMPPMGNPMEMLNRMMQGMPQGGAGGQGGQQNPMAMLQNMLGGMQNPQMRQQPGQPAPQTQQPSSAGAPGQPPVTVTINGQPQIAGAQPAGQQIRINMPPQPAGSTQQQHIRINMNQAQAQQARPAQAQARPATAPDANVVKLPHQTVFELGAICNRFMGANARFPGPPMPQLSTDRNPMVLLGSYLQNLQFQIARLLPYMQRCGDLLQREGQLTQQSQRRQTAEMTILMGQALEEVAKATGATAHLYKNFELGPQPGQCRMNTDSFDDMFAEIVRETGVVSRAGRGQQASEASQPAEAQAQPEERKTETPSQPAASSQESEQQKILARIGAEFNQMEMLTLIMGNFQQIKDFKNRTQKVLKMLMPDEGRSADSRKAICVKAYEVIRANLRLPDENRDDVYEQFDPALMTVEALEGRLEKGLDALLDFEGDDAGFIKVLKTHSEQAIVKVVSEIEEGFIDGMNDVKTFFKANCGFLIDASAPPAQAGMAKGMAIPTIMRFVERVWSDHQKPQEASAGDSQVAATPTPQPAQPKAQEAPKPTAQPEEEKKGDETQSLSDYLSQAKSAQERKQMLLTRYREQLQKDQAASQNVHVRPLSRAYQSLDLNANVAASDQEEKLSTATYQKESAQKALTQDEFFKQKMRGSLLDTGRFQSSVVDNEMKKINAEADIPEPLKKAFFNMVKAGIKSRLANDSDFAKLNAKDPQRYEYLNQL